MVLALFLLVGCSTAVTYRSDEPVEEESEFARHAVSLFVGGTHEEEDTAATLGLDYVYHPAERFGVGVFIDRALGDIRTLVLGAAVFVHPIENLEGLGFNVGIGGEQEKSGGERKWHALVRLGTYYELELGEGWFLAPTVMVDFTERTQILVFGFNLGLRF